MRHCTVCGLFSSAGTVRRFLEHYGDTIEVVVFVADAEDVSYFN